MATRENFSALAAQVSRREFIQKSPFPFLCGALSLRLPHQPGPTFSQQSLATLRSTMTPVPSKVELIVLPVRKVQSNFESMITLGRTSNNDIVLPDGQVSKFHAFFRVAEDGVSFELADAGSRNGTSLRGTRREPRGPAHEVRVGDLCGFGKLELLFLDAGGCWDRVHKRTEQAAQP